MRKALVLILLLLPVLSLNLTVQCDTNCYTFIPVNGYGYLNYTVNGSLLEDVYRSATTINATGTDLSTLMIFKLSDYSCSNPSDLFFDQSPVEAAFFEDLLVAKYDLTATNTSFKLFCDGNNDLRSQASWYDAASITSVDSQDNLTLVDGKYVLTGLTLDASSLFSGPIRTIERTYGNVTIAEVEDTALNISSYDSSLVLEDYIELSYSNYVYLDFANLTGDDKRFFVVSHGNVTWGNITILNEALNINATLNFSGTGGVTITDYDGDNTQEIVACVNDTNGYNLTTFEFGGTWTNSSLGIACESFNSFDPVSYPAINGSIITFNSTSLIWIVFNTTTTVYTQNWANIRDIASIDLDGDTYHELIVATTDGEVNVYNFTGLFTTQHFDYYGKQNVDVIDAYSDILTYNGSLNLYSGNYLTNDGELKYTKTNVLAPIKMSLNFSVGGNGNVALNTTLWGPADEAYWYFNQTYTTGFYSIELYPQMNGSLTINFTLSGVNASYDSWIRVDSLIVHNVSLGSVNFSAYENYTLSSIPINTTILSDSSFTIVGANFSDAYYLDYIVAFFGFGNHSIQFDAPEYSISLSAPSFGTTTSTYWVNVSGAIQSSQSESNFSSIAGFDNMLHLVTKNVNVSTYGTVIDYCSFGKYVVYTYGNATLLSWDSQINEVGNLTGDFTECWLNDNRIYLVNSTGGIDIYNFSLDSVGSFANSSFVVTDVVAIDGIYGANGTHLANISGDLFGPESLWSGEIYGLQNIYYNSNTTSISDAPGFDFTLDGLWDIVSKGVYSAVSSFVRIITAPLSFLTGFNTELVYFFDNGTIKTTTLNLSSPNIGIMNFTTNVTYDVPGNWISFDSTEYYLINVSVDGYYHNATDSLVNFSMTCKNSTYQKVMNFTKESNNTFTLVNDSFSGKYTCEIIPLWEVSLPKTFVSREFTAYSDSLTPTINSINSPVFISEEQAFNMTLNVSEDSEIKLFRVYALQGVVTATIISSELGGDYQEYNLSVNYNPVPTSFPLNETFNLSAEDYTGKISANFTTLNFTVYDDVDPQITITNDATLGGNIQDFSSVPLNLSIQVTAPVGSANISWINATLWDDNVLLSYSEVTGINNDTYVLWLNQSLTAQQTNYEVRVTARDIADDSSTVIFDVTRYGTNSRTLDGKWYSGDTEYIEYYWTNQLSSLNINDVDTGMITSSAATFDIDLNAPDRAVDEWWVFINRTSGDEVKSIKLKYNDAVMSSVTQDIWLEYGHFGLNTTDAPDTVIIDARGNVGSAEKMCLMICSNFNVYDGTCTSGTWAQKSCAAADDDENIFTVAGGDTLIADIDSGGVGFKINEVAITGTTIDSGTTEETTTVVATAGSAIISITAPTSKTVDVGSCVDVEYSISNTGSVAASISGISVLNIETTKLTFTVLSDINYPYNLGTAKILKTVLSFCPIEPGEYNPRVCAKVGTANKCISVKITGEGDAITETTGPLNMEVSIETFEDEYIVFVNSTTGPLEGATVTIVYPDGTNETFSTNVFGKVSFEPKVMDFTVTVEYGEDSITKEIDEIIEKIGFTVWRILMSFLIVGILIGFGVVLDEKMI